MIGSVLYWTDDVDGAADRAREFCRSRGLGGDDVKIVRRPHGDRMMIAVIAKRECKL